LAPSMTVAALVGFRGRIRSNSGDGLPELVGKGEEMSPAGNKY
jgi:hypothetical protein